MLKKDKKQKIDHEWKDQEIEDRFELIEFLGEGTYG